MSAPPQPLPRLHTAKLDPEGGQRLTCQFPFLGQSVVPFPAHVSSSEALTGMDLSAQASEIVNNAHGVDPG